MLNRILHNIGLITVFFFFGFTVLAQDSLLVENENIISYQQKLNLKLYSIVKSHNFHIQDKLSNYKFEYQPNTHTNFGCGVNYKWLGIGLAFHIPSMYNDDDEYGKTQYFDLQGNVYGKKIVFDVNFNIYNGFYLNNADELYNIEDIQYYPTRSDIVSSSIGFNLYKIRNYKNFSYKAAFIQNEAQKESAGSLIWGTYFSLYSLRADSSIIPFEFRDSISSEANIQGAGSINLGLSCGYVHTFIIKSNYFFTIGMVPGLGIVAYSKDIAGSGIIEQKPKINAKLQFRMAIGFNKEKWFGSMGLVSDNHSISDHDNLSLNYSYGNFRFGIGYRFNVKEKSKNKS